LLSPAGSLWVAVASGGGLPPRPASVCVVVDCPSRVAVGAPSEGGRKPGCGAFALQSPLASLSRSRISRLLSPRGVKEGREREKGVGNKGRAGGLRTSPGFHPKLPRDPPTPTRRGSDEDMAWFALYERTHEPWRIGLRCASFEPRGPIQEGLFRDLRLLFSLRVSLRRSCKEGGEVGRGDRLSSLIRGGGDLLSALRPVPLAGPGTTEGAGAAGAEEAWAKLGLHRRAWIRTQNKKNGGPVPL
jgi:hypothetical protein